MITGNACLVYPVPVWLDPVPLYRESEAVELQARCSCNVLFVQLPKVSSDTTCYSPLDCGSVAGSLTLEIRPVGIGTTGVLIDGDGCADQKHWVISRHCNVANSGHAQNVKCSCWGILPGTRPFSCLAKDLGASVSDVLW